MSSFERRLGVMERRTVAPDRAKPAAAVGTVDDRGLEGATPTGWHAAERVSQLTGVPPGTIIKLVVEGPRDGAVVEVTWDADGLPAIRML